MFFKPGKPSSSTVTVVESWIGLIWGSEFALTSTVTFLCFSWAWISLMMDSFLIVLKAVISPFYCKEKQNSQLLCFFRLIVGLIGSMFTKKTRYWARAEFFIQHDMRVLWAWCRVGNHSSMRDPWLLVSAMLEISNVGLGCVVVCVNHSSVVYEDFG